MEPNNLLHLLENNLNESKGITFIDKIYDQHITYSEIYKKSLFILGYLQKKGLKQGSEVIILTNEVNVFVYMFWACIMGGFIPVPISAGNTNEHKSKLLKIWNQMNSPYLFTDYKGNRIRNSMSVRNELTTEERKIKLRTIYFEDAENHTIMGQLHYANRSDIAFIQFSSGSTGDPKGVILTHENILTNLEGIVDADPCRWVNDKFFSWMPLTHDLGLIGFHLAPIAANINHCLMPTNMFIRSPLSWLNKVQEYKATVLSSPNFGYKFLLDRFKEERNKDLDLSSVRKIVNGAEPISYELTHRFLTIFYPYGLKQDVMVPSYGMAEAAVGVTFPVVNNGLSPIHLDRSSLKVNSEIVELSSASRTTTSFVSLGKAIKGTMIRICDESDNVLEDKIIGRVQLKGKNITRGYYNNSEATEKVINKDGWLITGDLGFIKNDQLIITGREKDIIFINGQNFYPHDIEKTAEGIDGINLGKFAVCGAFNEVLQKEEVIAFVLHRGTLEDFISLGFKVKEHLNRELAIDLASILPIKQIPRTTSGKVKRYILAQQYQNGEFSILSKKVNELINDKKSSRHIVAPHNEIEEELIQYFKEILGQNEVSINDHFFEMGGNSLKASRILGLIHKKYNIDMTFEELFSLPTVHKLATYIQSAEKNSQYSNLPSAKEREYYPLTPMQRKIYFMEHYEGIGTAYNVTTFLKLEGRFLEDKAQSAFQRLIDRHESLRTNYRTENGELRQIVHKSRKVKIEKIGTEFKDNLEDILIQPFNLALDPLIRIAICEINSNEFILGLDTHHIAADRISMNKLIYDFLILYQGMDLAPLPITYRDFSVWQENSKKENQYQEKENYWRCILEGELPVIEFPLDYMRPNIQSFQGESLSFSVNGILLERLRTLAQRTNTTMHMVLLSALQVLLSKYTGQEDIIVGTPMSGRYHPDLENIVGMFVNTLPIRGLPESKKTFVTFLNETKNQTIQALKNQSYSIDEVLNDLSYIKDPSRNPLFDIVFVMQNMDSVSLDIKGLKINEVPVRTSFSKFDLTLEAIEYDENIQFNVEYCSDLFKQSTINRLIQHFNNVLKEISTDPVKLLADINVLSKEEKEEILFHFNNTTRKYPKHKTIHQLFEEQVEKSPNSIALTYKEQTLTYKELNQKANNVASYLFHQGLGKGDYVGVFLNRGFEMIVGVLGILKAGAAYVPLDSNLPKERLDYIIHSLNINALIINDEHEEKAKELAARQKLLTNLVNPKHVRDNSFSYQLLTNVTSEDFAYVIFTSGSTGVPNGVRVKHNSVVNLIDWFNREFTISSTDRILFLTSLSFDLSVYDIFGILSAGGSIRIAADEDQRNPLKLLEWLKNDSITLWDSAPAAFGQLVPFIHESTSNTLRYIFLSGDWIPLSTPQIITDAFPSAVLISLGGATEATVWSNYYPVTKVMSEWNSIPYGKPIQNAQYYILDQNLQPCPIGVAGELYIGGDCLADGYINSLELNKKRFLPNPFIPISRIYKTGDKARWFEDGNIEFLGRLDFQVKIRGYRIELGEIQSVLSMHPDIKEAHLLMIENRQAEKSLCAYILSEEKIHPSNLRSFLAEKIPEYMIPSYFIILDKLPVTPNGKLDRKALPQPNTSNDLGQQYFAPSNETEEILVSIWEELLGVDGIGVKDNFFALGGDSIKAIQAAARLDKYNLKMDINDIFKFPTISQISEHVKKNVRDINQGAVTGDINLTPVQKWFFSQDFKDSHHFNQAFLIKSKSGFETERAQLVFNRLLEHHDALRIGIKVTKKGRKLFNHELMVTSPEIIVYDLTSEKEPEKIISKKAEAIQKEIDLYNPPLIKLAQFNTNNGAYLLIVIHHLIIDGVSWRILFDDFIQGYKKAIHRQEIVFPPKMDSFQAWSKQLEIYSESMALKKELPYWKRIEDCISTPLPKDIQSANNKNNSSRIVEFMLDESYTEKLLKYSSQAFNTSVETILLTALSISIYDWAQVSELSINLEGHGRMNIGEDLKIDRTIGWFTSIYPVLIGIDPDRTRSYQIKQVKEILTNVPNGGIGYGLLKYGIQSSLECQSSRKVEPEINFNYLGQFDHELEGEDITLSYLPLGSTVSLEAKRQFSININCYVKDNQFVMMLEYSSNEYLRQTMDYLVNQYKSYLLELIDYCINAETELTPSDLTFNEFDIDELDSFIQEIAVGLADEE
ncbi:non-ribosomal peptide synthetase [Cytobacillus purgationiresistens]|uniref:Amino acid adenylation domain-containing protein/non-ribosomal peptide synthase protein (TIGR01720 family) n=1 Tax=Cytobacillus purgationiresistens TaxID=863449 RepID=A0ABU0ARW3_9BACI|nr:non-ribosomal peptide synthetase [Cytobacillus purgationiresistens]MDQ0273780.1 amino acid adenylation domain-containing protein/non-ribosomal peptide synthase protein (TIGR01720 family) [Cytobacillus purgationiresistens]